MSLVQTVVQINFGIPTAVNTDTVGTDAITGVNSFTPRTPNIIQDIRHTVDPAAGLNYTLLTRRLDQRRKTLGFTPNFLTTLQNPAQQFRPSGMGIADGFVQFVEQQLAGALTAQNYLITLQQPLNV